jgi:threonine dehydratase
VLRDTGGELVHPFDDVRVIAGQATATLELLHAQPDLDVLVAPVSGGGLLSGTALAGKALRPGIAIVGAEPEGARDAHDSLAQGRRITDQPANTICDGLRAHLSERTFDILSRNVDAIELASEAEVVAAMRLLWERLKQAVEPSAAVALAAILRAPERFRGKRVGVILSGGNVDLDTLPWFNPPA